MILYILISFFIALLLWILLAPVIIHINTEQNRYHLTLPGILRGIIIPTSDFFYIRVWIFFIPIKIDPLKIKKRKKGEVVIKERKGKKPNKKIGNINMIPQAIRTFKIRKLKLEIDTNDFMLNAALVPAFSTVKKRNILLQVNFEGNSSLHLETRTRIGSLLWILFKYR